MGMTNVAHIDGGWAQWTDAGAPIESLADNKARHKRAD
jgi:3-mercaptopyruvate sulfurtransferase SseA